jgi:acyl-CoA thioesterase-1
MTEVKKIRGMLTVVAVLLFFFSCNNNEKSSAVDSNKTKRPTNDSAVEVKKKMIVFFGNSLTAGYGLSPSQAFPAVIQKKIDSLGLPYQVINAGVSGETSSGGKTRIDWILKQPVDIFVLELGANDGLRGIPLSATRKNLQDIVDKVIAKNPNTKLLFAGMQIPPNMGQTYTTEFRNIYTEAGRKEQNDPCSIPT